MDQDNKQDLFEIKLDETGISYIRRVTKIASAAFVFSILWGIALVIWSIRDIIFRMDHQPRDGWEGFQYRILPWIWMIVNIGSVAGTYYYLRFFRRLNYSITTNNSSSFNQAFRYALINGVFFLCGTVILVVIETFLIAMLFL